MKMWNACAHDSNVMISPLADPLSHRARDVALTPMQIIPFRPVYAHPMYSARRLQLIIIHRLPPCLEKAGSQKNLFRELSLLISNSQLVYPRASARGSTPVGSYGNSYWRLPGDCDCIHGRGHRPLENPHGRHALHHFSARIPWQPTGHGCLCSNQTSENQFQHLSPQFR